MKISFERLVDEIKSARAIVVKDTVDEDVFFPEVLNDDLVALAKIRLIYTDDVGEQYSNDIGIDNISGDITLDDGRIGFTTQSGRELQIELLAIKSYAVMAEIEDDQYRVDIEPYNVEGLVNPVALAFGLSHKRGSRATLLSTHIDGSKYDLTLNGAVGIVSENRVEKTLSITHRKDNDRITEIVDIMDRDSGSRPRFKWIDNEGNHLHFVPLRSISINAANEVDRLKTALRKNEAFEVYEESALVPR